MCADAPDTSGQQRLAESSERVANRQLDIQERLIPYFQQRQEELDALTREATDTQLGIMRQQASQAEDYYNYGKETFRPVEQSVVAQAMRDSTPEAYERYASNAAARSGKAFESVQAASERSMRTMGVSPANRSGVNRQNAMDLAAARGASFNQAYDQAEQRGWSRKVDATSLGRNLPAASTASAQAATGAGSAATGGANDAGRTAGSTIGTPAQYGGLGVSNMGNAVNANNSIINAPGDGTMQAVGGILGAWAGSGFKTSDKGVKRNRRKLNPEEALEGNLKEEVEAWEYDDVHDDGQGTHVGGMAQGIRRAHGEKVAPGGKVIDIREKGRVNQASIEALMARIEAAEHELSELGG